MVSIINERKITIPQAVLEQAKRAVFPIKNKNLRKRTFASLVAINMFAAEMQTKCIPVDARDSLTRVHSVPEFIDINTVGYGGLQIDVRVILEGNCLYIPKSHVRNEMIPDIYVGAKLNRNLNYVEFLGYIESSELEYSEDLKEHYSVGLETLKPMEMLPELLQTKAPTVKVFDQTWHDRVQELFVNYFDEKLSKVEKIYMIRHLFYCTACRRRFLNFYDFDVIAKHIQNTPEILKKYNIVGEADMTQKPGTVSIETVNENSATVFEHTVPENKDNCDLSDDKRFFVRLQKNEQIVPQKKQLTVSSTDTESQTKNRTTQRQVPSQIKHRVPNKPDATKVLSRNLSRQVSGHVNFKKQNLKKTVAKSSSVSTNEAGLIKFDLDKNPTEVNDMLLGKDNDLSSGSQNLSRMLLNNLTPDSENFGKLILIIFCCICFLVFSGYIAVKHDVHHRIPALFQQWIHHNKNTNNDQLNVNPKANPGKEGAPKDVNKAMVDGFSDFVSSVTISNLAWEVAPEYASNSHFINFLQNAGVTIQSNLQESLSAIQSDEAVLGDHVKVAFSLTKGHGVKDLRIEETSGSEVVDKTIKENILSTLQYFSYPAFDKNIDSVDFKLLIEF